MMSSNVKKNDAGFYMCVFIMFVDPPRAELSCGKKVIGFVS